MVSVFAAFALAESITIKSIGVGMAIAVLIDATIVRVLLVPATMRLMGTWNWWAPGPLARLTDRLGFSHIEESDIGRRGRRRHARGAGDLTHLPQGAAGPSRSSQSTHSTPVASR
jgi:RND superfamily putative drug exporter